MSKIRLVGLSTLVVMLLIMGGWSSEPLEVAASVEPAAPASQLAPVGPMLTFPADFMDNVKTKYGAKGDGVTDDTAAIQAALNDNRVDSGGQPVHDDFSGYPKALYFPAGTYLVSQTLKWIGCCMSLQGQGPGYSIIRLKNSAPGFNNAASPRPVLTMPGGNMSFHQNIFDLTVNTGSGNPGVVGIDYISSNIGAIRNVSIIAGDGNGVRGLDMTRQWPGPLLIKNLQVSGFNYGIQVAQGEYGPTFENINLSGQKLAGLYNDSNTLAIRRISSVNSVPAIKTTGGSSHLIVLDGTFSGGAASYSAIENVGQLYARNVTASGYASAIRQAGGIVAGKKQTEYISGPVYSLFNTPPTALNLPIEETPDYHDNNLVNWGKFTTSYYGDTSQLQPLLNSGKSTIYFPQGVYFSYAKKIVTVPASVRRIVGFFSAVNQGPDGGIEFRVEQNSSQPLIIENFKYGVSVVQASARPVVIKHGGYGYTDTAQAGKLFLEDVGTGPFNINYPHQVWARQLNVEGSYPKVNNQSGTLWILGLKTEGKDTVITTSGGGATELLGTLLYPATHFDQPGDKLKPAFINNESRQSLIYSISNYLSDGNYDIQVEETIGGVTKQLMTGQIQGGTRMPLYTYRDQSRVTKTNDNGSGSVSGSLSAALKYYRAGQLIVFALENNSNTINLSGQLPPVPAGVTLDGGTCNGSPGVILDGSGAGPGAIGLQLLDGNVTLRNLRVTKFSGGEIRVKSSGNQLAGCVQARH